jgi:hypothetical protein
MVWGVIMRRWVAFLAVGSLALWAAAANADQTNYDIGKVAGSELKIPLGAGPVGKGGANVGQADDLNATAWNPAGLAQIKNYQAGFMHNIYLQETSLEYLAYAQNLFEGAGLGAYISYFNYGTLDKVDEDRNGFPVLNGTFTPSVLIASIGYGQWFMPQAALGVAVKFLSQHIDTETYTAVAADLGVLIRPGLDGLQLGLAIQNLGSQLATSNLPQNAKVGAAYLLPVKFAAGDNWNLVADVNVPFGDTKYTSFNVGTEYWYNNLAAVRVGYMVKDTGDLGGLNGLTAGAGIKVSMFNLDYALVTFGDLGVTNQIMITTGF